MKSLCSNCHKKPLLHSLQNSAVKSDYWSSYVLHHLHYLWSQEMYTDIQIVCADGTVNAHKAVLYSSALYFRAFLETSKTFGNSEIVKLTDFPLVNVKTVLNFIYTGEVLLHDDNVMEMFLLADYLQVAVLREICLKYFTKLLNSENCLYFYEFAVKHVCHSLKLLCQAVAVAECDALFSGVSFLECQFTTLQMLIQSQFLKGQTENSLFNAILAWGLYQPSRIQQLPQLFRLLNKRFLDYPNTNIVKYVLFKLGQQLSCKRSTDDASVLSLRYDTRKPMLLAFLGTDGESIINSCEVYAFEDIDEHQRKWKYTLCSNFIYEPKENLVISAAPTKRMYSGMATTEYKLYLLGGVDTDGDNVKSCDTYSVLDNKWSSCTPLPIENHGNAGVICNGMIFSIGGTTNKGCTNQCYAYNFEKKIWQKKCNLLQNRVHLAAVSYNDYIYVSGGLFIDGESGNYLHSCEKYDPFSDSWSPIAPLLTLRAYHSMVVMDGFIYAIGGYNGFLMSSVERYDPMKNQWTQVNSCTYARCSFGAVVFNHTIYCYGGIGSITDSYARPLPYSEKYSSTGNWSMGDPLVRARFGLVPAVLFRCSNENQALKSADEGT